MMTHTASWGTWPCDKQHLHGMNDQHVLLVTTCMRSHGNSHALGATSADLHTATATTLLSFAGFFQEQGTDSVRLVSAIRGGTGAVLQSTTTHRHPTTRTLLCAASLSLHPYNNHCACRAEVTEARNAAAPFRYASDVLVRYLCGSTFQRDCNTRF